jgi:hypothetical protein
LIWEPKKPNNPFGHAAIQTNTYHMSLWPDGDCKEDFGYIQTFLYGVKGSLVFHHNFDYVLEGKREPLQYNIEYCSMKDVDVLYEEMLEFNDITPDKVTLDSGNEIINRGEKPEISLDKSKYSFKGKYLVEKTIGRLDPIKSLLPKWFPKWNEPIHHFYIRQQSCTTFCMNLLLNSGAFDQESNLYEEIVKMGTMIGKDLLDGILEVPEFKTFIENKFKFPYNCIIS